MSEAGSVVRVALVDDHEVVRVGLAGLLAAQPDFTLVGEAGTVQEALELMRSTAVDVLLLDIRLPDGSGIDVCRQWAQEQPSTHIIILTSFGDDDLLFAALEAGAAGYLLKNARGRTVLEAIRTVADGGSILDPAVASKVLRSAGAPRTHRDPLDELTPQERRILALIAQGLTNREIGARIFLSEKTVKHYVSNILDKLGLTRRAEAAAYLARREPTYPGSDAGT
jgi:two-component system response regulator DevR